jgi:2-keto-4-pentenoate hydratase
MTLTPEQQQQAADELIARRRDLRQGTRLSEAFRPVDLDDAWQVQQRVTQGLGLSVGGWKCSVPSAGKLVAAPIYTPTIVSGPLCDVTTPDVKAEPEFAFVLGRDLPPRGAAYSPAEIDAAIGVVHAALELCASRYTDHTGLPFAEMLADGLVNHGLWLGPELTVPESAAYTLEWQTGAGPARTLPAAHGDGNPRLPLYWLVNFLSEKGLGLRTGQAVITGSYAGVLTLPLGEATRFSYGDIASFEVGFRAA